LEKREYSVIIPVLRIEGNDNLNVILTALAKQELPPKEVHFVAGDKRQGRAINYGVSQASCKYIATLDDDTIVDDNKLFSKLLEEMEKDPDIGICGAACEIPENATFFQKRAMCEIPRRYYPVQRESRSSDMVQHPCLIMEKKLFEQIGGEDEELIRGLDPILRKKVRDTGKKCVIAANTWIYHLIPDSFTKLLKMYYRNGRGSGYASHNYPERILELTDGYDDGVFIEKRWFIFRVFRRFFSLLYSIITLKFLKCATDIAYGLGVLREKISPSCIQIPEINKISTEVENKKYPFKLFIHKVELEEL